MNHYTILGCDNNIISMLFEIISTMHNDQIVVDIVKNIKLEASGNPYKTSKIKSREIDAENWEKNRETKYLLGVLKPATKHIVREYFLNRFSIHDEEFTTLIHEHTTIASTAVVKNGVIINPGVVIAPYTTVDRFVNINRNTSLGHHTTIGEYAQINPAVNIAGNCSIGKNVVIGMGTNVFDHLTIGNNSIIGAGSLVTKNIPDNVIAYGSPAKVVSELT